MNNILKHCPFCAGESTILQYGNARQSTICECTECGCRLETSEEFNHGNQWNTRPPHPAEVALQELTTFLDLTFKNIALFDPNLARNEYFISIHSQNNKAKEALGDE